MLRVNKDTIDYIAFYLKLMAFIYVLNDKVFMVLYHLAINQYTRR